MRLPAGHQAVVPYYMVIDARKLIAFAAAAFDATVVTTTKLSADSEAIVHGEMVIEGCTVMFADASAAGVDCDATCHDPEKPNPSTVQLLVYVEDAAATVARAVGAGATSVMEVSDQEDGRMGGILDPFGNLWWVKSMQTSPTAS